MTPILWIFNPFGSLYIPQHGPTDPLLCAEEIGSHLVPEILGPEVCLFFHQNVLFNRFYAFYINVLFVFDHLFL